MHKTPLHIRMMPFVRREYLDNTACPSVARAALGARKALSITSRELHAIHAAWVHSRRCLTAQAQITYWEQYAAGIIYNAETTL